jgi:hypothetical protein
MNLFDFICEWCSEIQPVLVNGVVKLNLFLVELNLFLFLWELGAGVQVGAGSRFQLVLGFFLIS